MSKEVNASSMQTTPELPRLTMENISEYAEALAEPDCVPKDLYEEALRIAHSALEARSFDANMLARLETIKPVVERVHDINVDAYLNHLDSVDVELSQKRGLLLDVVHEADRLGSKLDPLIKAVFDTVGDRLIELPAEKELSVMATDLASLIGCNTTDKSFEKICRGTIAALHELSNPS